MNASVLIVASHLDIHAAAACSMLRTDFGIEALRLDLAGFPTSSGRFTQSGGERSRSLEEIQLDEVRSVWWRRPARATVPRSGDRAADDFCQSECDEFVEGVLWSLDTVWVNDPGAQHTSSRKVVQLATARSLGMPVPETVITNDASVAADFVSHQRGRVIYKRTGTGGEFSETRLVTDADLARLTSISRSPTTFQEYIDAEFDLRIVWVAGEAWTVRIDSQAGAGRVDSRMDNSVAFSPFELPDSVAESLGQLMSKLGLVFGVIDMRMSARDGQIYFLEVNPQGQFAYLEIKTGLPIFRSLAALLAQPDSLRAGLGCSQGPRAPKVSACVPG